MSDAELDKELASAGFDVEKERAEAHAFREKLERSVAEGRAKELEARARVRSMRATRRRPPVIV
jgi:hypothetical protein